MNTNQSSYFFLLRDTVVKDIEKLKKIAQEGEDEYNRNKPSPPTYGPNDIPTTHQPYPSHFQHAISQPSRCTIPLAMLCLSNIELLGNLISTPYCEGFQHGAKQFFIYAGISSSNPERELLREIFRNGLMHVFFPKGPNIGITYDSSLETRSELFVEDQNKIILNVNYLCNTVLEVIKIISNDNSKQQIIENNLQTVANNELSNIQKKVGDYNHHKLLLSSNKPT